MRGLILGIVLTATTSPVMAMSLFGGEGLSATTVVQAQREAQATKLKAQIKGQSECQKALQVAFTAAQLNVAREKCHAVGVDFE